MESEVGSKRERFVEPFVQVVQRGLPDRTFTEASRGRFHGLLMIQEELDPLL